MTALEPDLVTALMPDLTTALESDLMAASEPDPGTASIILTVKLTGFAFNSEFPPLDRHLCAFDTGWLYQNKHK